MTRNKAFEQYLVVGGISVFFFWLTIDFLKPVIFGLFLALVMYPLQIRLTAGQKLNRSIAAFILTTILTIAVVLPLSYISVTAAQDAASLARYLSEQTTGEGKVLQSNGQGLATFFTGLYNKIPDFVPIGRDEFITTAKSIISSLGTAAAALVGRLAQSIPAVSLDLFFVVLSLFFGLSDGKRLTSLIKRLLPFDRNEVASFFKTTDSITRGVVIGSLLTGIAQGSLIAIGFAVCGVPRAAFFGMMTLILSFIPFVGSFPAGAGGVIYLFVMGHNGAAIGLLIIWGLAMLSDNIIKPIALKGEFEIHPMLALMSVIGGLAAFGFTGLFLGPLIAALFIVTLEILSKNSFNPSR